MTAIYPLMLQNEFVFICFFIDRQLCGEAIKNVKDVLNNLLGCSPCTFEAAPDVFTVWCQLIKG